MTNLMTCRVMQAAAFTFGALMLSPADALATGTARIVHPDGSVSTYSNVRIIIWNQSMAITSADGLGTVVLGKAACTRIGELVKCIPWDATLFQYGEKVRIPLQSGTVWLNPSGSYQQLSHSSTQIPPRGVLLAAETKRGTYLTMSGVVDEVHR